MGVSLIILIYVSVTSASFVISETERRALVKVVAGTILEAIEAGPLKYSRLHAQKIADEEIQSLLSTINREQHVLARVVISTGKNEIDVISDVFSEMRRSIPATCIANYQRTRIFPDAIYPYHISIEIDECAISSNPRERFSFILLTGIALVTICLLLSLIVIQPVKKSFDLLIRMLNSPEVNTRLPESELPFVPFRRLAYEFKEAQRLRVDAAIARTTQMLAHDVRKPFALFRMTIDRVKTAGTPQQVQLALQESLPEVERSLASVNGLISDVLNVGGEFSLVLKPVRLAPIVDEVIDELRKLHPTRTLRVQTDILPDVWVEADDTRLPRVFLNILSNAIEAVTTTGVDLWVNAQGNVGKADANGKNIEVRVGNAGSYIPPDACEKLFDLFYTSGKKGGTGLGLAIVRKIIEGHGGHVKCQSERTADAPQGKVEFVFTLRATVQPELATVEPQVQQSSLTADAESNTTSSQEQAQLPKVIFLDDSPLARWAWETKLKGKVDLLVLDGPKAFWTKVGDSSVSLSEIHTIITDHYFAPDEKMTGLEFASELRVREFKGRILLASNGEFTANELAGIVDKIVDKQPAEWETLNA
ncbi:MAG: hypothetical protein RL189_2500 [Pseudomonadota bacterium]